MKKIFGIFLIAISLLFLGMTINCTSNQSLMVSNLRCEYLVDPLGMDKPNPRFSWEILSGERAIVQSAYRVFISDDPEDIRTGNGNIWDSGKIISDQSVNIEYTGPQLQSDKTYYWNVNIWTQKGEQSVWSKPSKFHTGFLNPSDWKASWISATDSSVSAPLFRKGFASNKTIKEAFLYITAAGYYEAYLNGAKIGDHVLDPSVTDYRKRILYATYDVSRKIRKGSNILGVMLGNGAFHLKKTNGRYCWGNGGLDMGTPGILAQLNITYKDGSRQSIVSDQTWKCSSGPITFNNIYGGEDYDARLEKEGWNSTKFDDSGWQNAIPVKEPGGIVVSQMMPAVKVTNTLLPMAKTNPKPGVYLFDMGQNFSGWWRVKVRGSNGLKIRIRGAETLNDSLFPKLLGKKDNLSKKQSYQEKIWTDYTLKGKGTETYEPRFFYTGFRYIEVTTDKPDQLKSVNAEGRVVRTALEDNGHFRTSDSLINRIHHATLWSIRSNTLSYPTDCPQREKGGYTGDGQIVAEASMHDFQMPAFYTNWLNDMKDAQEPSGRIPNTSPTLIGGNGGGIAWGSAYVLVPWWMYQYYNDTRVLKEHYSTMQRFIGYLHNLAKTDSNPEEPYIINNFGSYWHTLGEWCAPWKNDDPNHPMIHTYYYYKDCDIMSKIAAVLGKKDDADKYAALADTIKNELNKKFFNSETNLYGSDTTYQTYQILALSSDIIPEGHREKVLQTLKNDIVQTRKMHHNVGIIGNKYIWPVLNQNGMEDIAWSLIKQTTFPSFGYWINKGATTLRETWNGVNSQNHQMFGAVDEYFYKFLAGIGSPSEGKTTLAYKHINIQPYVPEELASAEASLNTAAGEIKSGWEQYRGNLRMKITIPPNTDATVNIPKMNIRNPLVKEKGKIVWMEGKYVPGDKGISNATQEGNYIIISIGSGDYEFILSGK